MHDVLPPMENVHIERRAWLKGPHLLITHRLVYTLIATDFIRHFITTGY